VSVSLFKLYRDFHDFALYHSNRSLKNSNSPVPGKPYPPMLVAEDTLEPLGVHARHAAMGEAVAVHVSWSPDNASDIEKLLQRRMSLLFVGEALALGGLSMAHAINMSCSIVA
jgi:hypothetical protein